MKNHLSGSWRAAQHYTGVLLYHLAQLKSQEKNTCLFQESLPLHLMLILVSAIFSKTFQVSASDEIWDVENSPLLTEMGCEEWQRFCKPWAVFGVKRVKLFSTSTDLNPALALQKVWCCRCLCGFARGEMRAGIQILSPKNLFSLLSNSYRQVRGSWEQLSSPLGTWNDSPVVIPISNFPIHCSINGKLSTVVSVGSKTSTGYCRLDVP